MNKLRRITRIAIFIALALIMHFVEAALPPLLFFAPGAKMGLGNVIILVALIILGILDAYVIVIIKCLLAAVFGGNFSSLMYSLPAGLLSLSVMMLLYLLVFPKISLMAISFVGAVVHNLSQLLVASFVVSNFSIMAMLPFMLLASVIAGLFVGIVAHYLIKALPQSLYYDKPKST